MQLPDVGVFKSEDLTPVEWASHSARVWGEYQTPAMNKTQFVFSLKPKGWIHFINSVFGGRDLLLNVNSYNGEERRHWHQNCSTCTWSRWRGLRFVPRSDLQVMEVWHLWFESLENWKAVAGVPHPHWLQAYHITLWAGCMCVLYLTMRGNSVWL